MTLFFSVPLVLLLAFIWLPALAFSASVRPPILAGTWYKGTKNALIDQVDSFLEKVKLPKGLASPVALISPHAGYVYSGQTAAYGFQAIKDLDFHRVIVLAPSHRVPFHGLSIADVDYYKTPIGRIPVDRKACRSLLPKPIFSSLKQVHKHEHSLEIQLPFVQRVLKNWTLVPIVVGDLKREEYDQAAAEISKLMDSKTLLVASSDFTHYGPRFGYVPFRDRIPENLHRLDHGAIQKILSKDFEGFIDYCEKTGITICGFRPIGILLNVIPKNAKGQLLNYDTSGRILNDYRNSVSYVSILFSKPIE